MPSASSRPSQSSWASARISRPQSGQAGYSGGRSQDGSPPSRLRFCTPLAVPYGCTAQRGPSAASPTRAAGPSPAEADRRRLDGHRTGPTETRSSRPEGPRTGPVWVAGEVVAEELRSRDTWGSRPGPAGRGWSRRGRRHRVEQQQPAHGGRAPVAGRVGGTADRDGRQVGLRRAQVGCQRRGSSPPRARGAAARGGSRRPGTAGAVAARCARRRPRAARSRPCAARAG